MSTTPTAPKDPFKLFYCYAHEDKPLRDKLDKAEQLGYQEPD